MQKKMMCPNNEVCQEMKNRCNLKSSFCLSWDREQSAKLTEDLGFVIIEEFHLLTLYVDHGAKTNLYVHFRGEEVLSKEKGDPRCFFQFYFPSQSTLHSRWFDTFLLFS